MKNKWIVFLVILMFILTPNIAFARGFHGGGHFGGEHLTHTFHDDEGTGHTFHDEDEEDNIKTHFNDEETDDDTQSFGSRVKDTFNYLIPRAWHNHHSIYYHVDSDTYSDNQDVAFDQLNDWMDDLFIVYFVIVVIWVLIPEDSKLKVSLKKMKGRVKDLICKSFSCLISLKGKHSISSK